MSLRHVAVWGCNRRSVDSDRTDTTRTTSPLVIAPDAVHVDTTGVPVEEVVGRVMTVVEERTTRAKGFEGKG